MIWNLNKQETLDISMHSPHLPHANMRRQNIPKVSSSLNVLKVLGNVFLLSADAIMVGLALESGGIW